MENFTTGFLAGMVPDGRKKFSKQQ